MDSGEYGNSYTYMCHTCTSPFLWPMASGSKYTSDYLFFT